MTNNVALTNHFISRYRERVAKTTPERISKFANEAYNNGKNGDEVKSSHFRKLVIAKNEAAGGIIKIYKGFVYVFSKDDNTALTIYRIPKQINGVSIYI